MILDNAFRLFQMSFIAASDKDNRGTLEFQVYHFFLHGSHRDVFALSYQKSTKRLTAWANKRQMPHLFQGRAFMLCGGTWRIRTAVHGFADRWLSHSSKVPIFFKNAFFLNCDAKVALFFELPNHFLLFILFFCSQLHKKLVSLYTKTLNYKHLYTIGRGCFFFRFF